MAKHKVEINGINTSDIKVLSNEEKTLRKNKKNLTFRNKNVIISMVIL